MAPNNPYLSSSITPLLLILTVLLACTCTPASAQTPKNLTTADNFGIPPQNGAIRFGTNGTYTQATLENGVWLFTNLSLNSSRIVEQLKVSAVNSEVTILTCETFDTASSDSTLRGASLTYTVTGQGTQTFNFGLDLTGGEWGVTFNEDFFGENEGWTLSPDQTVTVTDAPSNCAVSVICFRLPSSFGNADASDQPFYQQHSVAITTAVLVAVVVVLGVAVYRPWKKQPAEVAIG